ncbi:myelin protein zero-like protein 2 [Elgaria multicarinata webbii]|uniref:myelin protein zero-like protein 2 n=1 Tax=Elgaria multicarinata webbii TaxID=159646 RepID=UPI002FCD1A43
MLSRGGGLPKDLGLSGLPAGSPSPYNLPGTLRSSGKNLLQSTKTRLTTVTQRTSSSAAPRLWNGLLEEICQLDVLWPVVAVEIFTPGSLEALNGTDVRLKCTFRSHSPIGRKLTVSWNFQSQTKGTMETVFYYNEQAYPPSTGRFADRVMWDGDAHRSDASIVIGNVRPSDNGTFQCHVKNPPDVDGAAGEIQLSVVLKVSFSEIHILALAIGTACLLMILVVVVVVVCRHRRRIREDKKTEMVETELPEKKMLKEVQEEEEEMPPPGEEA